MKTPYTRLQIVLEVLSVALLAAMAVYAVWEWVHLPARIPTHFGLDGQVDSIGSKNILFFPLAMGAAFYILFSVLMRFPQNWNTGAAYATQDKPRIYSALKTMILGMKLCLLAVFFILEWLMSNAQGGLFWLTFLPVAAIVAMLAAYSVWARRLHEKG